MTYPPSISRLSAWPELNSSSPKTGYIAFQFNFLFGCHLAPMLTRLQYYIKEHKVIFQDSAQYSQFPDPGQVGISTSTLSDAAPTCLDADVCEWGDEGALVWTLSETPWIFRGIYHWKYNKNPRQGKTPERYYCSLSVYKGGLQERWEKTSYRGL